MSVCGIRLSFAVILVLIAALTAVANDNHQDTLAKRLMAESPDAIGADAKRFGDPRRGAAAFYRSTMNCAKCHVAGDSGRRLGPNLAERRNVETIHLIDSVLNPSSKIHEDFQSVMIQLDDGRVLAGVLVEETETHLVVDQIEQPDKPLRVLKDEIDDWKRTQKSTMPTELVNQLADRNEFLDLVSYLDLIAREGEGTAESLRPSIVALAPLPAYESRVDHAGLIASLDKEAFKRGEEIFRLRCASCHGTVDEEGSMPTSLRFASGKFKHGNDPLTMYQTLTHGYGMMNPQRWMVPEQKYDVIHYVREHFLKPHNASQYIEADADYLRGLPAGDTRGPKPVASKPWTRMDYGHSMFNTIEVSDDESNIAQKGIVIRLDDGPGGVESGSHWIMYDHDTMRVAGAWNGGFIDYEGIHFNGVHGRHPKVSGNVHFSNATGPGFGHPQDGSFDDQRVVGRDGKQYGPLPREWAQYRGMYRFGRQSILDYTVGDTKILEMPSLAFAGDAPVFVRHLNLAARQRDLVLQVTELDDEWSSNVEGATFVALPESSEREQETEENGKDAAASLQFDGATFVQIDDGSKFKMRSEDFTITARIKTRGDGTIFSKTYDQDEWIADGKTLFVRNGRLVVDIGWVGEVGSHVNVADGRWHAIAVTYDADESRYRFFVDGKKAGEGTLEPEGRMNQSKSVVRIGFTNENFPNDSFFDGQLDKVAFYQHRFPAKLLADVSDLVRGDLVFQMGQREGSKLLNAKGDRLHGSISQGTTPDAGGNRGGFVGLCSAPNIRWIVEDGALRLHVPAGPAMNISLAHAMVQDKSAADQVLAKRDQLTRTTELAPLTKGGPPSYPETLTTKTLRGNDEDPFAVDVLVRPKENPWNAQLRLTGVDFLPGGNEAVLSAWDGSIWHVSGTAADNLSGELKWRRIAAGLFQPLGIKFHRGKIHVTCRDQLVVLNDLNGDGEADHYECFNNDHQVTEHFHEFAMGLQIDDEGNFYYAKSARHALKAVVPHHGTLLKISPDGKETTILATGFRAANGVCLNPDGSFVVTDQEGHWNPKNRINWVDEGGFYGNMFGYHDVTDDSDEAMADPLCWITNAFDRSPSELVWVDSQKWGPLKGSLLNFSYGYGKIHIVPFEKKNGQVQGGMCEFPIEAFPTGVMRGRFSPDDGQLYCCGMFAWAGSQQQPGGFYRVRYTGNDVYLPIGLEAMTDGVRIKFSGQLAEESATDSQNFAVEIWGLARTANYGSKHYNQRRLKVVATRLSDDGKTVELTIPDLEPTWGMEINYSLMSRKGTPVRGKIHNTIHHLEGSDSRASQSPQD